MSSKRADGRIEKLLRALQALPENKVCFECGMTGTTNINMFNCSFVCTRCSGILREFPNNRVKSISASTFTLEEVKAIEAAGNLVNREIWLATYNPSNGFRLDPSDNHSVREFIRSKYVQKKWFREKAGHGATNVDFTASNTTLSRGSNPSSVTPPLNVFSPTSASFGGSNQFTSAPSETISRRQTVSSQQSHMDFFASVSAPVSGPTQAQQPRQSQPASFQPNATMDFFSAVATPSSSSMSSGMFNGTLSRSSNQPSNVAHNANNDFFNSNQQQAFGNAGFDFGQVPRTSSSIPVSASSQSFQQLQPSQISHSASGSFSNISSQQKQVEEDKYSALRELLFDANPGLGVSASYQAVAPANPFLSSNTPSYPGVYAPSNQIYAAPNPFGNVSTSSTFNSIPAVAAAPGVNNPFSSNYIPGSNPFMNTGFASSEAPRQVPQADYAGYNPFAQNGSSTQPMFSGTGGNTIF